MRSRVIMLVLAALLAPTVARAQEGGITIQPTGSAVSRVATRGANFLGLGVGGRALALAGAYVATAQDLSAMYWNPAGLADVQSASVLLSREELYGSSGLRNTYVAAAMPLFGGALGVSLTSFGSGKIERTNETFPDGGDPAQGSFIEWNATAVGLHYGRPFTDRLSVGLTAKYATEGIQFASQHFVAADVGVRFRTGLFGTTFGATVLNLGTSGQMDGPAVKRRLAPTTSQPVFPTQRTLDAQLSAGKAQLPTTIRIGIQTDIFGSAEALWAGPKQRWGQKLALYTTLTDAVDTEIMPAFAAEYSIKDRVFFRVGKQFLNDERTISSSSHGLGAGAGIAIPIGSRRVLVDYAYRNFGELEGNQVFSFQLGN